MLTDGQVVIALDGSPHSARTLDWGLNEAGRRGADVVLAHVYRDPRDRDEWGWEPMSAVDVRFDAPARHYLAEMLGRAEERRTGLTIDTRPVDGSEVDELRRLSENAQLLVIGARDHRARARFSSVTRRLVADAGCPVAVVRDDTTE